MNRAKPFDINLSYYKFAFESVKESNGSAGIDGVQIQDYAENLDKNLYKLWNRMSSGSYFPAPLKLVEIPKPNGGKRPLSIPTVEDRIAQQLVCFYIDPKIEPIMHENSYAYQPFKGTLDAVKLAKERCFKYAWVLDMDISKFFDTIDHELLMKAVRKHVSEKWIILYIERWLKAPIQTKDGQIIERTMGVPQGSVIGPVLANLFMHYVFDRWMQLKYDTIPFERYADDIICHCKTEKQTRFILNVIKQRFQECKLKLNETKTKIVLCKTSNRKEDYPNTSFDFLGFTFRPRSAVNSHTKEMFTTFTPAISDAKKMHIKDVIRELRLSKMLSKSLEDIAKILNPKIRGWINYYAKIETQEFGKVMFYLNYHLAKWLTKKYKDFRGKINSAIYYLKKTCQYKPNLFVHWSLGYPV